MLHIAYNALLLRPPYSGVEHAICDLMEALAQHGRHRYTFFTPASVPLPECIEQRQAHHVELQKVKIPLNSRLTRVLWEQLVLPRRVSSIGADILHAPGYLSPLHSPVPVVLTVYDIEAILSPRFCKTANRLNYAYFLPRSIAAAAAVITPSSATREQVAQRFPRCISRLRPIPLAVHDTFFASAREPDRERIRRHYGLPRNYLLFVGNQEPRKNIPALLTAIEELRRTTHPDLALVLAGAEGRASRQLRERIHRLGATGALVSTGYVPRRDLPHLYRQARALVFPSWDEGFGLPPLEAMAVGCPVVCSSAGALAETAPHAASFDPDDPAALIAQLTRVLGDATYRNDIIQAGHKHAANYRWHSVACQVERLYEQLAEPPHAR